MVSPGHHDETRHPRSARSGRTEEAIFDAALRQSSPARRRAFLASACAGQPTLHSRVEALLKAQEAADQFFEQDALVAQLTAAIRPPDESGPDASAVAADDELPEGTRIGRYRLIECIGRGGCGVVYLAEQEAPLRRQVALKIIRRSMETRGVIARFEAERQALAMMDHPCIARVFDASTTDWGAPFFVMEHVRGLRITEYCDHHRLTLRGRLDLFVQICHAIQHAHQKGIIHGDIKPSNIIISQHDGVPMPKVIDFGISRATDTRLLEEPSAPVFPMAGTPAYMSPEQMEMGGVDVDTRSDVYSLGVLLHELLAGQTPVPSEELEGVDGEALRSILGERIPARVSQTFTQFEPSLQRAVAAQRRLRPAQLVAALRGDLDSIVAKALEKDRRQRYETSNALAMEIGRHLNHEPVSAHAASWYYRLEKQVRRNRGVFAATGAVALALIMGLGLSTWLFLKERDARERAVAAEQQQARLRQEAETREKLTQAALMVSQERFAQADAILADVRIEEATVEGAAVFRAVGEWHALHERWPLAVERFTTLVRINQLDGADVTSLDHLELGPALIEAGDRAAYERFRQDAITRFSEADNPFADRIVKISLLTPASPRIIEALQPLAKQTERFRAESEARGDSFQAAWRSLSLAIYDYRRGDFTSALSRSQHCLDSPDFNHPRSATALVVRAMAEHRLGRVEDAQVALAAAAELIATKYQTTDRGTPVQGFWFDWALARLLLREAETLLWRTPAG